VVNNFGRAALVAIALALTGPSALLAQGRPLRVTGVRDVQFGIVIPGLPAQVLRTDAANSGQYSLTGDKNRVVQLQFTLPTTMNGPSGATMPLSFGASDAGFSPAETVTSQVGFDPRVSFVGTLSNNGRAAVFLGGQALPAGGQRSGTYTATITLTVSYLGL
jgi:hypothetical protein